MPHGKLFLFAGGGSGGHLIPGMAVAQELIRQEEWTRVVFVGSQRGVEQTVISRSGFEHLRLPAESTAGLRQNLFRFARNNRRAYQMAKHLLRLRRPDAVIGLGGFASVPVILAAYQSGTPTIVLEQNIVPGRATRWLSRGVALTCLSFAETVSRLPKSATTTVTGNPVRHEICRLADSQTVRLESIRPTLLILGGSQGASALNAVMPAVVRKLCLSIDGIRIVHQTGEEQVASVRAAYEKMGLEHTVEPFFSDLARWYRQATVAISRAGATTLAELACAGVPAVLIPYPYATADHQLQNARWYEDRGAACVVEQTRDPSSFAEALRTSLTEILQNEQKRRRMQQAMRLLARPDAAHNVANQILNLSPSATRKARANAPAN